MPSRKSAANSVTQAGVSKVKRKPRVTDPPNLLVRAVQRLEEESGHRILFTMPPCTRCAENSFLCQLELRSNGAHRTCEACRADGKVCDVKLTFEDGTISFFLQCASVLTMLS